MSDPISWYVLFRVEHATPRNCFYIDSLCFTFSISVQLKLSTEHSGFTFEKDPAKSVQLLKAHSGGKGSQALLMAMSRNVIGVTAPAQASDNIETPTQALLVSGLLDDKKICPDIKADKCQTTEQKEEKPIESTAADIVTEKKGPLNLISKPKKETGLFACFSGC